MSPIPNAICKLSFCPSETALRLRLHSCTFLNILHRAENEKMQDEIKKTHI